MKSVIALSIFVCVVLMTSCFKPKEPFARICPEEPTVITTADTLLLENCSENYDSQRWEFPNGSFSTQNKAFFSTSIPGVYTIVLKVKNNDYANEYIAQRMIEVKIP